VAIASLPGCSKSISSRRTGAESNAPAPSWTAPATPVVIAQSIYDGGLKNDWLDFGWSPREVKGPGPARVDFSKYGGWIIAKPGIAAQGASFGGITFRVKTPPAEGDFLELRVESIDSTTFPRIKLSADQDRDLGDGWREVVVPMTALDPDGAPFDRVILRAFRDVPAAWGAIDKIGLLVGTTPAVAGAPIDPATARPVRVTVDCRSVATRIDPRIYGFAYYAQGGVEDAAAWAIDGTIRRWGGNPTSRYNWELGNAWNTANDWYFENVSIPSYVDFLKSNASHHVKSAVTLPTLGWVAKDTTSSSFPVATFGAQQATDGYRAGAGNGKSTDGKPIAPGAPTSTSVAAPPEFIRGWVEAIRKADAQSGTRSVDEYILDNEPCLWNSTHRDVHPQPLTYDELLEKTIAYGSAVRAADPDAVIAGPALWGWPAYQYSAKDSAVGTSLRPDRRAHGDVPLLPWWLGKVREHDQKTGTHLIDLVDVHFYPQAPNVYGDAKGDAKTDALRIRSTRALWDPTYKDESWINESIMLLPRLKKWIAESYPGRGVSIGEYNFGGESRMSGALAEAEVLGRFGQQGVASAFYWTYPKAGSPTVNAFRAYRDFDGAGGHFLEFELPASVSPGAEPASLFASRDETGTHLVLVLLNLAPASAARASVQLDGCGPVQSQRAFTYAGGPGGLTPVVASTKGGAAPAGAVEEVVAPYSITVIDLHLQSPAPGALEK
jgi:hypothetical protein